MTPPNSKYTLKMAPPDEGNDATKAVHRCPVERRGRDNRSTFAYIESICVSARRGVGTPDQRRIQTSHNRHFGMINPHHGSKFPIRLAAGTVLPGPDHDKWDCIDDMEHIGLIEDVGTGINPSCSMHGLVSVVAAELRRHKTRGGASRTFDTIRPGPRIPRTRNRSRPWRS